jgi:hypothetical protein
MKTVIAFALLLSTLISGVSRADTSEQVVRIACVPEAGLLHIEPAYLHDSVKAGVGGQQGARDAALAQAGFHDAHALAVTCVLGNVTYFMSAEQDVVSARACGGDPEIYLTVKRNAQVLLNNVPFGETCNQIPSVTRLVAGDGPHSWRGREMQVCYAAGPRAMFGPASDYCDWTFGKPAEFDRKFPVDQARLPKILSHEERR